nr:MAG TPA: hypothetical protein [Caudoviricetes sp.]
MIKKELVSEVFKNVCFVRSIKKRTEGREAEIYPFTSQNYKVILGYHLLSQRFTPPYPFTLKVD